MSNDMKDGSIKYNDLKSVVKLPPLHKNNQTRRVYKIKETLLTPKILSMEIPHNSYTRHNDNTEDNNINKESARSHRAQNTHTSHVESTKETQRSLIIKHKAPFKYADVGNKTILVKPLIMSNFPAIQKEYEPINSLPNHLTYELNSPYQLIEEFHDVINKISNNCSIAPRVNIMRSEYLVNKINRENNITHKKLLKSRKEIKSKEEVDELYDSVIVEDYYQTKLKNSIHQYLRSKDNKLNQVVTKQDPFFDTFENKINFQSDVLVVPSFMNKFIHFNLAHEEQMKQFNSINYIHTGILKYLYTLKVKVQKDKDEMEELRKKKRGSDGSNDSLTVSEENEDDSENGEHPLHLNNAKGFVSTDLNQDINQLKQIQMTKELPVKTSKRGSINPAVLAATTGNINLQNILKDNKKQVKNKTSTQLKLPDVNSQIQAQIKPTIQIQLPHDDNDEETSTQAVKIYEMEDFFVHKYIRYENVSFAQKKERDFILNNFNDLSFKSYYSLHIPQALGKIN